MITLRYRDSYQMEREQVYDNPDEFLLAYQAVSLCLTPLLS